MRMNPLQKVVENKLWAKVFGKSSLKTLRVHDGWTIAGRAMR